MKKKILWAVIVLLLLAAAWRLSWPRFLPVLRPHGDLVPRESFEEMVNRAELIVLADVKSVKQGPDWVVPIEPPDFIDREPTQRITLEVVKVYKGDVAESNMLTLFQCCTGITTTVTRFFHFGFPAFQSDENNPVYSRGERYMLMLSTVSQPEDLKQYQPEPWQEGMFAPVYPEGRMLLNENGTVTSVWDTFGTNGKTLAEIEEMIAVSPVFSLDDLERARESLFSYLSLLHAGRYAEAVKLYGGSYDILRDWNPALDSNDYAALFENGCETNGLMCLDVAGFLLKEVASPHEFKFNVEFITEDGSLFVSGSETLPQSQFVFTVSKDEDGKFLVQDLPVYVP